MQLHILTIFANWTPAFPSIILDFFTVKISNTYNA